jgi:[acyl-carrier-protein] S-malonyltransferase
MQSDLAERFPVIETTYAEASEVLGYDLWGLVTAGPGDRLAETTITQPAMLAAGVAAWRAWNEAGGRRPALVSGHSLGEYTALVCAEAIGFDEAMAVVKRRAELMQEAVPAGQGAMAAILGLEDEIVGEVCAAVAGVAEPVNYNSPGQVVIAGETSAVNAAVELAKEKGARRAIVLPVSVPSHSSLMRGAGEALAQTLANAGFRAPAIPVVSAATARPYGDASDIRRLLATQVFSPVRWTATIEAMIAAGADRFVECGPGKVLAGLVRRIDKSVHVASADDFEGFQKALAV